MSDLNEQENQASLKRYLNVLRRQWVVVAIVILTATAAAIAYSATRTPVYAAQTKIVVGQGQALFGADASSAFQPFTQTMTDLLESDIVAQRVIAAEGLDIEPSELLARMKVTTRPDTSVLDVTYEDEDRERAVRVLRRIGNVFTALVSDQLAPPRRDLDGEEPESVSATVFDPAHTVPGQVSPHTRRTVVIAIILGLITGIGLAFLRDALSPRIRTQQEAEEAFGAQVVGMLPRGIVGTTPAQVAMLPPRRAGPMLEALQFLTATLRYTGDQPDTGGVILVTSAQPEDGKSTVVAHVSEMLTQGSRTVVAVEADVRRASLHRFFGIDPTHPGLTDTLRHDIPINATLVPVNASPRPGAASSAADEPPEASGNLLVMPAGRPTRDPHLMSLGQAANLIAQLRGVADYVVIDTPPFSPRATPSRSRR